MSDGLGCHVGLLCSPGLGSAKRVTKNKTHILLFNILLVFLCKSYSFQVEELSLVLDFHRSNELYKLIKFPHARRILISICTIIFYQYMFLILFISNLVLWSFIFLLLCGDIEVNPGPDSVEDSNSSSETLSATYVLGDDALISKGSFMQTKYLCVLIHI